MRSCIREDKVHTATDTSPVATERDPDQARSFQEMVAAHSRSLYRFALHLARDPAAAEDLVQQAFLNAWRSFHTFRPGSNARTWLLRILRNEYFDQHRRAKHHRPPIVDIEDIDEWYLHARVHDAEFEQETRDPEAAFFSTLTSDVVASALADLRPQFREVFALADLEELSYREISEILGIPEGTVMSRLHRARLQLQKALWDYCVRTGQCRAQAAAPEQSPVSPDCHEACRQIYRYLDRTLDAAALVAIDRHMQVCHRCCTRVEFQRRLGAVVQESLGTAEIPDRFRAQLRAVVARF
jgi:RNA polymerase sigma-70 factor (ECF subfamily)